MTQLARAREAFVFYTRLHLTELTGLSAPTLPQFAAILKTAPDSCIYQHTHRFLQQHQYLSPEPPNDFAYWASEALGDDELGEKLASIDTVRFSDLASLRERLVQAVEEHIARVPSASLRHAGPGEDFYFMKAVSFVLPTPYRAYDLREFAEIIRKITIHSIYFHIFEARLRLAKKTNDFSNWIENSLGDPELARQISALDPYTHTLEELRKRLITLVTRRLEPPHDSHHSRN